jgi:hypothetical protein
MVANSLRLFAIGSQFLWPRKKPSLWLSHFRGDRTENRTPIARLRIWCPNR